MPVTRRVVKNIPFLHVFIYTDDVQAPMRHAPPPPPRVTLHYLSSSLFFITGQTKILTIFWICVQNMY